LIGSFKNSFGETLEPVAPAAAASDAAPAPGGGEAPASEAAPAPAAVAAEAGEPVEIILKPAGPAGMEYDQKTFTVKAGQKVKLKFVNEHPIPQPHNVVISKPGTKDKVMADAMQMAASPDGMAKGYVPETEDILFHTKLVQPTQTDEVEFVAPEAGAYPYICTFPGHAILMNGVMTVE
jgi:azurin